MDMGAETVVGGSLISKALPEDLPAFVDFDLIQFFCPKEKFLVGYGMDYKGGWRHLPYVTTADQIPRRLGADSV
jgi:hypoxanthine phosphoribosyltransferase